MILLDLGPSRLLLRLQLQSPNMFSRLPDTFPRSHQRTIRIPLGRLGHHHALASLHDGGVDLVAGGDAVAEGAGEKAGLVAGGVPACGPVPVHR